MKQNRTGRLYYNKTKFIDFTADGWQMLAVILVFFILPILASAI